MSGNRSKAPQLFQSSRATLGSLQLVIRNFPEETQVEESYIEQYNKVVENLQLHPDSGFYDLTEYKITESDSRDKTFFLFKVTQLHLFIKPRPGIREVERPVRSWVAWKVPVLIQCFLKLASKWFWYVAGAVIAMLVQNYWSEISSLLSLHTQGANTITEGETNSSSPEF